MDAPVVGTLRPGREEARSRSCGPPRQWFSAVLVADADLSQATRDDVGDREPAEDLERAVDAEGTLALAVVHHSARDEDQRRGQDPDEELAGLEARLALLDVVVAVVGAPVLEVGA